MIKFKQYLSAAAVMLIALAGVVAAAQSKGTSLKTQTSALDNAQTAYNDVFKADLKKSDVKDAGAVVTPGKESKKTSDGSVQKDESASSAQGAGVFKGVVDYSVFFVTRLWRQVLAKAGAWTGKKTLLTCRNCGYATNDMTLKTCPVCLQPREQFSER